MTYETRIAPQPDQIAQPDRHGAPRNRAPCSFALVHYPEKHDRRQHHNGFLPAHRRGRRIGKVSLRKYHRAIGPLTVSPAARKTPMRHEKKQKALHRDGPEFAPETENTHPIAAPKK